MQASGLGQTKNVKRPPGRSPSLHPKTSAQPHSASPAAPGAWQGCSWRSACADDSHRGALRSLQDLGGAGASAWRLGMAPVVWGLQAWIRLRVPCGKGRKVGNGLEFGLMKKMSSKIRRPLQGGVRQKKPGLCEFACCNLSSRSLCIFCSLWGPWGSTVSLAALFLPIFMHSLGDGWHLGSEDLESLQVLGPCSAGSAVSGALLL